MGGEIHVFGRVCNFFTQPDLRIVRLSKGFRCSFCRSNLRCGECHEPIGKSAYNSAPQMQKEKIYKQRILLVILLSGKQSQCVVPQIVSIV